MSPLVFSIRPQHVAKLVARTKRFEFRTRRPSLKPGDMFLIYESRGRGGIVAEATVKRIVAGSPAEVWAETAEHGGVTEAEFAAYFNGRDLAVAIEVEELTELTTPVPLPASMTAPQAWARWKGEWATPAR